MERSISMDGVAVSTHRGIEYHTSHLIKQGSIGGSWGTDEERNEMSWDITSSKCEHIRTRLTTKTLASQNLPASSRASFVQQVQQANKPPKMHFKAYILAATATASTALAHMEMIRPFPLKSQFDPNNDWSNIDYDNTSPLEPSGKSHSPI